jgi:ribosomal protein L37AE/L43A
MIRCKACGEEFLSYTDKIPLCNKCIVHLSKDAFDVILNVSNNMPELLDKTVEMFLEAKE